MSTQSDASVFTAFIERTKTVIPGAAEGAHRNISDLNLLRYAAAMALESYPREWLVQLFVAVIDQASEEVRVELAALLVSFYRISDEAHWDYQKERNHKTNGPWYRFELDLDPPAWIRRMHFPPISPQGYARTIVAEVVAQHLIEVGGWERPARLAPSRRAQPRRRPATTP
jgi:hypothetical protein